jgi:hypothetical protein
MLQFRQFGIMGMYFLHPLARGGLAGIARLGIDRALSVPMEGQIIVHHREL